GMLVLAQAGGGWLVPARIEAGAAGLSAYAVRASDGGPRVCLINKELHGALRAVIAPGWIFGGASVLRLTGPAIDATAGITLGGAAVDEAGEWTPTQRETIEPAGGAVMMDLSPASAALVELRAGSSAAL